MVVWWVVLGRVGGEGVFSVLVLVTRSMYCSCTVDVERVAEQNRKRHRRCTGRRAT